MNLFNTLILSTVYIFNSLGQYLTIAEDGTTSLSDTPVGINLTEADDGDYNTGRYDANANSIDWILKPSGEGTYTIGYNVPDGYATAFLYTPNSGMPQQNGIALTYTEPSADFTAGQWMISSSPKSESIDVKLDEAAEYTTPDFAKANVANITLLRKLYAKEWNTFCVPFPISAEQISNIWGTGTRVATFKKVSGSKIIFSTCDAIKADEPCIIEPMKVNDNNTYQIDGIDVGSWGSASSPSTTIEAEDGSYTYMGSYSPMQAQKGNYALGGSNKMYHLTAPMSMNGYRAIFKYSSNKGEQAKQLTWGFAEDTPTGIDHLTGKDTASPTPTNIYQMDGKMVKRKATTTQGLRPGVYIMNGMKVVVK